MSLDTQPHHPDTVAAWHDRYGHDDVDGTVVHWTQNGWAWSAERRDDRWWINLGPTVTSASSARGHTWDELCSRLARMSATAVVQEIAGVALPPRQLDPGPPAPVGPLIPFVKFPNLGGFS